MRLSRHATSHAGASVNQPGSGGAPPTITLNCQNSQPCITLGGSGFFYTSTPALNVPFGASIIEKRIAVASSYLFGNNSFAFNYSNTAGSNNFTHYFGSASNLTLSENAWHALSISDQGTATSPLNTDGAATTGRGWERAAQDFPLAPQRRKEPQPERSNALAAARPSRPLPTLSLSASRLSKDPLARQRIFA